MAYREHDQSAANALRDRIKRKELVREQLRLAGAMGHRAARLASGGDPPPPTGDFASWFSALIPWGRVALVRACVAAARLALPLWEQRYPRFPEPRRVVELTESWLSCMCDGCARIASDASFAHGDYDDLDWRAVTLPGIGEVEDWAEAAHWACDTCPFIIGTALPVAVATNGATYAGRALMEHERTTQGGMEEDLEAAVTGRVFDAMRAALRAWAMTSHPFGFQQAIARTAITSP